MTEEIIHRLFQVVLYTGGFIAFWQITKHMPKVFHNMLENFVKYSSMAIFYGMPIAIVIEFILVGNIHNTMAFVGCVCGVSLLCGLWMVLVSLSRALQGKKEFKNVVI